ncbi:PIR Superfamily Protein [Plasmodium ovale curtisi]|uniref:PIR Superfamily Protein n=1 Tax=Plasmodium ovale curtisi TaxID=864141 RepID=A0A1A8XCN7_PLAOA|nr:PIR Superfamily Protein [Plasmodium ovale curtisi]
MVTENRYTRTRQFNKKILPSGLFLEFLYDDNKDVETLKKEIESFIPESDLTVNIPIVNDNFESLCANHKIVGNSNDENGYCRDVNYYLDLVNGIIKSINKFSPILKDKIINNNEDYWKKVPEVKYIDKCTRKKDLDSIRKRCILKQIHDLKIDKNIIQMNSEGYNNYLNEKWNEIIKYTNEHNDNLFIKIENDYIGIIEKYENFLVSSDYICDAKLDELSADDITISRDIHSLINTISLDNISSNIARGACYNKSYIDMLKTKTSTIQRVNNFLSIGIAFLGFTLILIFLYKFSPLGSLLRRFSKKKIEIDENMSEEEMSELYDNSENGRQYIFYNSVSQ